MPSPAPELSVVVPAYNEEARIGAVANELLAWFDERHLDAELLARDDGSRDATAARLAEIAARDARLAVVSRPNRGHGPTLLEGFAAARGAWIAQLDGDGEVRAAALARLWERRAEADLLIAARRPRRRSAARKLLSAGARFALARLFGAALADPNSPCRLWRGEALRPLLAELPGDLFAPNVVLCGLAARQRLRLLELDAGEPPSARPASSLAGAGRLLAVAVRSWRETARAARRRGGR